MIAEEGNIVRFHVLGMGDEFHSFHLHAHRWLEPGSDATASGKFSHIIDTEEIAPLDMHVFVVRAGEGVGSGDWMYHCHVFRHMEEGMSGTLKVLPKGTDDTLPPIGAVFTITDEPGRWFKTIDRGLIEVLDPREGIGFPLDIVGSDSRSFAVTTPGETLLFNMKDSITLHTVTSLIFSENAAHMPFDIQLMLRGSTYITDSDMKPIGPTTPGLYVFICKIHPYMFGAVSVDSDGALPLDVGSDLTILTTTGGSFPTTVPSFSALALELVKTFFVVTDPTNWKDYTKSMWEATMPNVDVTNGTATVNLSVLNIGPVAISTSDPTTDGKGEVLVNTQFEETINKNNPGSANDKPGTIIIIDPSDWSIKRKIALPEIMMNHPHNMWTDVKQHLIYQTQWFDKRLVVIERDTGIGQGCKQWAW